MPGTRFGASPPGWPDRLRSFAHSATPKQLSASGAASGPALVTRRGLFGLALVGTAVPALELAPGGSGGDESPAGTRRHRVKVKLTFLDRDGHPTPNFYLLLVNLASQEEFSGASESGTVVLRLPRGRYYLEAGISGEGNGEDVTFDFFAEPTIGVFRSRTLTLDARDAKPLRLLVDRPEATGVTSVIASRVTDKGGSAGSTVFSPLAQLGVRPSRSQAPGQFTFTVAAHLGRPDGDGGFAGSPYQYHLQWSHDGSVPEDLTRRFRDQDLSRVESIIAAQVPDRMNSKIYSVTVQPPATVTEWVSPGAQFFEDVFEMDPDTNLNWAIADLPREAPGAGSVRTEQWNMGPFGPAFGTSPSLPVVWCGRFGDEMHFDIPHFSDQHPDHFGFSATIAEERRLFRNGEPLISQDANHGIFTVPPGLATYRYETRETREVSPFSIEVRGAWTFRSGHVAGGPNNLVPLPMAALRFAPALDQLNRAPAGQQFEVPLYMQVQEGATVGQFHDVTVDASYDDGQTWLPAPVVSSGSEFVATLNHPASTGFVSLRASATSDQGNRTELTIIHAYELKT